MHPVLTDELTKTRITQILWGNGQNKLFKASYCRYLVGDNPRSCIHPETLKTDFVNSEGLFIFTQFISELMPILQRISKSGGLLQTE